MSKLKQKRKRVIVTILAVTISNALVTATPSLNIEIGKKLFLTFANVVMFIIVWDAYFDEELSQKSILSILQDLFSVTCVSIITTFILSQGITKIINKLTDILGMLGWGIAGAIAAMVTAVLGIMWASYCDDLYRNSPE